MAKRFTDTNKYKKPFVRGLQGAYKLLWDFLYHDCDHAGIWIVDFDIAQLYLGKDMMVNKEDALKYFNAGEIRVVELDGGCRWFIASFIEFQYGVLSENNRAHNGIILTLRKYNLIDDSLAVIKASKPLTSPLQGDKDMDKDMDKDKEGGMGEFKNLKIETDIEKKFNTFQSWILTNAPAVARMKEPITIQQYEKLGIDFAGHKSEFQETLLAMHNTKDLLKKYNSANLTLRNWIKRRLGDQPLNGKKQFVA